MKLEKHIDVEHVSMKAVDLLAEESELSRQQIKKAMTAGAAWITDRHGTHRIRRADKILQPGDTLHLYYDDDVLSQASTEAELIADEGDYSIWFKPAGMLSQGSKWGDHTTIYRYAEKHLQPQRPAFIVHRLDRAASGLIILAHSKKMARKLADMFRNRLIEKRYHAIVHGDYAGPDTIDTMIDGKPAISHVRKITFNPSGKTSLLEISIETGRKHQVRRHLADAGFPIVGDRLHGRQADNVDLQLRACLLSFIPPADDDKKTYTLPDKLALQQEPGTDRP